MEGCGMNCIKYLLVVFNGLFLIFGIVIIATASVDLASITGFTSTNVSGHETDAILIAVGVLIIVVAAFGCFGAWKEKPRLLYIFAGCLILIAVIELSVGIAAALFRPQIEDTLKTQLRASFIKFKSEKDEDTYKEFWDHIQTRLKCCGVTGPTNYDTQESIINLPFSCCPNDGTDRSDQIKRSVCINHHSYHKDGCEDKLLSTIHSAGLAVIACGIFTCCLEVVGIVLALKLAKSIKTQEKRQEKP